MPIGKRWKKGESGNPSGRPKDGESWAAIVKTVSNMDVDNLLDVVGSESELGKTITKLPRGVQIKYLVTIKVFASLLAEPSAGLFRELLDRAEGKVTERAQIEHRLESVRFEGLDTLLDKVYGRKAEERAVIDTPNL